jgi:hypothetical protein
MSAPANLVTLRPGLILNQLAAQSWARMERDYGRAIDCNSSYRDWDLQARWHKESLDYNAGKIKYPGHAYAVDPRYSEHCLANAVDTDDWNKPGFLGFAAAHGWIQTDKSKGEEHHLAYRADRDQHRNDAAPASTGGKTPISNTPPAVPPKPQGDSMFYIRATTYPTGTVQSPTGPFAGATYRRDEATGAWRACTNIETEAIIPDLIAKGLAEVYPFNPFDLELLFAVDGLLEQTPLPENAATWGGGKKLAGLGAPTGRIIFPGSETEPRTALGLPARGKWHNI